jgi:pimeloyl-ACP methyl ester carboxylesterase
MRITPPKAASLAAFLCVFVSLWFLQRALLVVLLALKILGNTAALDSWKGAVSHQTLSYSGIPVDVYGNAQSGSPILIVHGVNPTGKNSLDLVRISEALAQVGYAVYVPDFVEMKRLHVRAEEAGNIKTVFKAIGRDAGVACFSYGCGPAMIAASDPEIQNHVRFGIAFGGYFDIREALEHVITGPETPTAYLKWAYLAANADLVTDQNDQSRVRKIAETLGESHEELSPDAKSLLDVFSAATPEDFRARLKAGPESLRRRLDGLSPSQYIRGLRAPLILVHGINDPIIPAQQSIEFADAARANGVSCSLTLLRMYGHVNPVLPEFGATSLFAFYVPETLRFLGVLNDVIAIQ